MRSERLHFPDIRNTSTFRLTLLLGLVTMVGLVALVGLIYGLSVRELNARTDGILRIQSKRLMAATPADLPGNIQTMITDGTPGLNYFGLLAPDGARIIGPLGDVPGLRDGRFQEVAAVPGVHGPIRMLATRTPWGETILVGRDITPIVDLRERVTEELLLSGVVVAALTLISGIALSLAPLRRVDALQRSAQEIAAGDLDKRMPIMGRGDELDLFAGTVNTMVEEVSRVVSQVKAVTDAVAHDLRTPLTRVRTQLYRASREAGADASLVGRIELAIADLDTVLERFAALLRISELEARSRRAGFGDVALPRLIGAIMSLYEPLAEERGIALSVDSLHGGSVYGDEKLLFEAIGNLVDNAIKFAPVGGHVSLSLRQENAHVIIEVRDDGPGIPLEHHKSVLRRFDRGDAAAEVEGTGLGLSVVAAILHLHKFELEFADAMPGLIARIMAPHP
ncbi:sensor histidine kinase [Sphingomonas abietis]|uniref:histidine kinase n=1 Tax=Sphingomonas abietis TaxID=3012344 RepID=A0ABY7NP23_9SPHN|nr:HAMP domain-containing sensor histidine kinase [Sphingomonas abietis]WBO23277.1 HAMP domain-containing sensor histidine kinase [Sphingomonas abietis]